MAPKKRACSKPELYNDFTVWTELQQRHRGLKRLTTWWLICRRLAPLREMSYFCLTGNKL